MIKVLLVDDHRLVRAGLQSLLDASDDIRVVGTATDGQEAIYLAAAAEPDVVLMDLSMPRMGGVEATRRRLRADHPDGQKDADPADLIEGVRAPAAGQSPLDPKVARTLLTRRGERAVQDQLSDREREVLVLVADGMPNKQIARRLGISERTVKAHLTSIFQRIGVTDRTQAALWAERNGLRR